MNTQQRRIDDGNAEKRRELARVAAEWGRVQFPPPPPPKLGHDGRGTLVKFPWE